MMKGLEHLSCEESLRELGLFKPEAEQALGDLMDVMDVNTWGGAREGDTPRLFSGGAQRQDKRRWAQTETQEAPSDRQETLFSTVRVTKHWHRLPREVVESPSLEILKSHLDTVLGNRL